MRRIIFSLCLTAILGLSTIANAALINNGGGLIYDSDLNITWFDNPSNNNVNWQQAMSWASGLTAGGVSGWRLPSTVDGPDVFGYSGATTQGYNITTSEMGHLFYTELGNKGAYDVNGNFWPGWSLLNKGPFTNLQNGLYWSGTEHAPLNTAAWTFLISFGSQDPTMKGLDSYSALAVHDGNVSPVPIPGAILLFAPGLAGLGFLRRRFLK